VVFSTNSSTEESKRPEVSPFQNWFNKNQERLMNEYEKEHIGEIMDSDKFMQYAKKEYNGKEKK